MSAQSWGTLVHTEFETLVRAWNATNPMIWGETGYGPGGTIAPGGKKSPKLAGFKYPDVVFGASTGKPELLFDLKTGLKLAQRG